MVGLLGHLVKWASFLVKIVEDLMGLVGLLGKVGLLSSRDGSGPDGPPSPTPPVGSTKLPSWERGQLAVLGAPVIYPPPSEHPHCVSTNQVAQHNAAAACIMNFTFLFSFLPTADILGWDNSTQVLFKQSCIVVVTTNYMKRPLRAHI